GVWAGRLGASGRWPGGRGWSSSPSLLPVLALLVSVSGVYPLVSHFNLTQRGAALLEEVPEPGPPQNGGRVGGYGVGVHPARWFRVASGAGDTVVQPDRQGSRVAADPPTRAAPRCCVPGVGGGGGCEGGLRRTGACGYPFHSGHLPDRVPRSGAISGRGHRRHAQTRQVTTTAVV